MTAMTFTVPEHYGWVVLGAVILPLITNMYMGGPVMNARKAFNVLYPNLYAVPGVHKEVATL